MIYPRKGFFPVLFLISVLFPVFAAPKAETETVPSTSLSELDTAMSFRDLGMTEFPEPMDIPIIELKNPEGQLVSTDDYKGKIVFLNFWATWCPPCRMEMPSMETLYKELEQEDFVILAVSVGEDSKTVSDFLQDNPYSFPIVLNPDNSFGSMFAGRGIPTSYILNKEGKAVSGIIGAREWDDPQTIEFFRSLSRE